MLLHFFKFVFVKAAGLVENLVLNADLAHVVQHGGPGNLVLVLAAVFGTDILVLEEKLGNFANPAHMFAGFLRCGTRLRWPAPQSCPYSFHQAAGCAAQARAFFLDLDFRTCCVFRKAR